MPNPSDYSAGGLANNTSRVKVQNDALTQLLLGNNTKAESLVGQQAQSIRAEGEAVATVSEQRGGLKLKTEESLLQAAKIFGTDLSDPENRIAQLAIDTKEYYTAANASLDKINAKESVDFLSNPLQYIGAQLTVDDDYSSYNYSAKKYNLAFNEANNLNQLTQTQVATQRAIQQTETSISVAASAKAIREKANETAINADLKVLAINSDSITLQKATSQQELENMSRVISAKNEATRLAFSQQEAKDRRDLKAEIALDAESTARRISLGIAKLDKSKAGTVFTATDLRQQERFATPESKALLARYHDAGLQIEQGASTVNIAPTPGDAALLVKIYNSQLGVGQEGLHKALKDANSFVDTQNPGLKIPHEQLSKLISAQFTLVKPEINVEKTPGGAFSTNIYGPPTTEALVKQFPFIADTKLYQEVIAPLRAAGGDKELKANLVFKTAATAILSQKLSINDATAQLRDYYKNQVLFNNTHNQYESIGLKKQESYRVPIGAGGFDKIESVDLNTDAGVRRALVKTISNDFTQGFIADKKKSFIQGLK